VGGGGFLEGFLVGDKVSWRLGGVPVVYGVIYNKGYDTRLVRGGGISVGHLVILV